jgi:lipooligosaccharide transport system permease protein
MVSLVLPRIAAHAERRLQRATAVANRNVVAFRHASYWWLIISGFFEPLLYLLSIGIGVGVLVGDLTLPGGRVVSYPMFVAPAMLATSAMNGAMAETTFNFFGKMKFMRLYDAVLATPVAPFEIALGELMWALVRGSIYSVAFLAVMVGMGLTTTVGALAAVPATLLIGMAFGGIGMMLATFVRGWQDFDYIVVIQFALFLFSGTFAPAQDYHVALRVLVEITPLYHAVELVRAFTVSAYTWGVLWHVAYLAILAIIGLTIAGRRMGKLLCK